MMNASKVEQLIHAVEKADSANSLLDAVENLASARDEAAIPTLLDVLRYNNPGASVAAVDGLIEIGKTAVPYLLANVDGYNYGARAWATRALAGIGDVRGLDLLLDAAANDFSFSVRRGAARGLGKIIWSDLSENKVLDAQKTVFAVLERLSRTDPEWVVRYAAIVGLEGLAEVSPQFREQIIENLERIQSEESEIVVRARAQKAIARL